MIDYEVVRPTRTESVVADHYEIWDGALVFEDERDLLIKAFAPGSWISVAPVKPT